MPKWQSVLITISTGLVGLFCAWQLTSQTVIAVINANVAAQQAISRLQTCEAKLK